MRKFIDLCYLSKKQENRRTILALYKIICSRHTYLNLSDQEKTICFIFSLIFVDTFPMQYLRLVFVSVTHHIYSMTTERK